MTTNIYMIEAHEGRRYIGRTNRSLSVRMVEHKYQSKTRNPEMHALLVSKNFEAKVLCQVPDEHGAEFEELVMQMEKPALNKMHARCSSLDNNIKKKRVETMHANGTFGRSGLHFTAEKTERRRMQALANLEKINALRKKQ